MITVAWWWVPIWLGLALAGAWFGSRQQWRRWRRQQRRHEVRIRLVGPDGLEWLNVTCDDLALIRRWGGTDDPPWQTLEVLGPRVTGMRLQVAPAYPEAP